ncbi:DUF2335 domain-containing protein [Enterobacter hormaechei]|uniref:DUF2335 domain-containing protein n=1 Tax=Enterobacter cloacae complex TaxID=354276 RepID=UPI0022E50B21|nr:DUF2335 domain-containing protein [Enterobacter kobei]EKP1098577.1 DUF2335 domain-containing protein [Enterobacter hormaechei]ELX8426808.1 DUF2335 domain-containing protein [Enterobacter hormaechei subsp. hoffmannii]EKS6523168.1 DUF2335 domain-containing protein [Enterobacter hormaechei]EKU5014213.1 DUF2335 domain-containing protein [Enterobacter hormaechei]EKW1077884.1 DUF2335 domain-containing protein [Enterobacter hormaechei]
MSSFSQPEEMKSEEVIAGENVRKSQSSSNDSQRELEPLEEAEAVDDEEIEELAGQVTKVIKKEPELLERIMDDDQVRKMVMVRQSSYYSGPLPPYEIMQGYEEHCPGATKQFIDMLETNQTHNNRMHEKAVDATIERDKDNRKYAYSLTIIALIIVAVLGLFGHDWLAGIIGSTTILTILATFILNKLPSTSGEKKDSSKPPQAPKPPANTSDTDD